MNAALRGLVPLRPDNFTPLTRTPWGGQVLARTYKRGIAAPGQAIGEAWEFSCDPAFPSRLADGGGDLLSHVRAHAADVLSPKLAAASKTPSCEILVKLLDAAAPLSLQVHPKDGDAHLAPGECGKPESWLVLAAEPAAGIYLGFSRAHSRDELRKALRDGDQAKGLLHFEPVKPGDYFEIEPGVPHAIGGGVTLLEPQRILTGLAGKTYRLWDWGRRYDAAGREDPAGKPRELHVEESLPLVDPMTQVGPRFVATLRRSPETVASTAALTVQAFPANPYYRVLIGRSRAGGAFRLDVQDGYGALVVLAGAVDGLRAGHPALLPHAAMPLSLTAAPGTEFALVIPASSTPRFS